MSTRQKIALIYCVSKKLSFKARAEDLYVSPYFIYSLKYARKLKPDDIFILSAKHGLLSLDNEIEPYDLTLNEMGTSQRKKWASKVLEQIKAEADLEKNHFIILAGEKYRQYLIPNFMSYEIPLEGLAIGKQLQYLKKMIGDE